MQVITKTQDLQTACDALAALPFITVDTEFLRETTFWPKLCLVQMAGDGIEMIVDPLAEGLDLTPFYDLMANETVVKVFHAARQDVEIIHKQAGIIPKPLFDSQVAAMVCGFGDSISYGNLVKRITGGEIDKSSRFTDWARRPLSQKQLVYALGDVTHLRDVYQKLSDELAASGRTHWLTEEMAILTTPATYVTRPEDSWKRLKSRVRNRKGLAVLMELAAWRERRAQTQNVPRNRVLRDDALYDIANQAPTETSQLSRLRTLSEGFARSARAKEIVAAVRKGLERDIKTVPPLATNKPLTPAATALLDLLRVLLKASAAANKVAPKLISSTADLEIIASQDNPDVAALKGWRRELFGAKALLLKAGKLALSVRGGEVVTIPADPADGDGAG